jgi:hypothetical protein
MKQIKAKRPLSKRHSDGKTPALREEPEDLMDSVGLKRAESAFQPPLGAGGISSSLIK